MCGLSCVPGLYRTPRSTMCPHSRRSSHQRIEKELMMVDPSRRVAVVTLLRGFNRRARAAVLRYRVVEPRREGLAATESAL